MDNDDQPVGRILNRREALKLLGVTGAAFLAGCVPGLSSATPSAGTSAQPTALPENTSALPACVVRPEATEGPYYVDEDLNRSDVRSDPASGALSAGSLLALTFNVSRVASGACTPLEGARVEIWHCDAQGVYSDVADPSGNTQGQKFLRGYQLTGANGQATFTTIYPGWYPGRAVHIHFKVHPSASDPSSVFTSQLFFDDAFSDQVYTREPYAARGQRNTLNSNDGIYQEELLLAVNEAGEGYAGVFSIGLQV